MKPIVVIPARGGSKRILKKNISIISGKPVLGLLISKLDSTGLFDEIIVSTDDAGIEEIAVDFGAKVSIRKREKLSDDITPSEEVIRSYIMENQLIDRLTPVFCIYPLAVLIEKNQLLVHTLQNIVKQRVAITDFLTQGHLTNCENQWTCNWLLDDESISIACNPTTQRIKTQTDSTVLILNVQTNTWTFIDEHELSVIDSFKCKITKWVNSVVTLETM